MPCSATLIAKQAYFRQKDENQTDMKPHKMAIAEHVKIITAETEAFDQWRAKNHGIRIDCSGADLADKKINAKK
jgi:hypothetical protein